MNEINLVNEKDSRDQVEWKVSSPEKQGLDSKVLTAAIDYIKMNFPSHKSISIYRNECLVFEHTNIKPYESTASKVVRKLMLGVGQVFNIPKETFKENESEKWNMRSASKSIISLLIGIAIEEGFISSAEEKLESFFQDYFEVHNEDIKKTISVRHLLTMKSGLGSIDRGLEPLKFMKSHQWVSYILERPLQNTPGEKFDYNSANAHLLSAIITKATGMNAAAFAENYLFKPLGISDFTWEEDPQGHSFGGGNLFLKPHDLAKIGLLLLQNGFYRGRQIVSQEWIKESLSRFHLWDYGFHYGYLWYIKDEVNEISGNTYVTYSAAGAGGQKLLIIPKLNLIVAATSQVDYFKDKSYFLNLMIGKFILPAVIDMDDSCE